MENRIYRCLCIRLPSLEDPFLLLASAVQTLASDAPTKRGFVAAAGHVGKALLPITAKAIVKVATAGALDLDEAEKTIVEAAGAAAEKVVEGRIREFEKERKSFATFRKRLNELAAKTNSDTGRPLVLFIDELDRCRPDFAVKTLERIKHLFDVPRVSFVLLLHTEQLQYAVEGVYGSIDSVAYLRKFIHFTLPLPKTENQVGRRPEVEAYIDYLAKRVSLHDRQAAFTRFVGGLKEIAPRMDLAFRDVERVILDFVLRRDVGPRMYAILLDALSFVLPLKVKHPALFQRLLKRDKSALPVAKDLLDRLEGRGVSDRFTRLMLDIIESHVHGKPASKDAANRWDETKGILGPDVEHAFGLVATDDE